MAHIKKTGERVWTAQNGTDEPVWHRAEKSVAVSDRDGTVMLRFEEPICGTKLGSPWGRSNRTEHPTDGRVCKRCERIMGAHARVGLEGASEA